MAHRLSDCTVKVKTQYNTVFLKLIFFQNSKQIKSFPSHFLSLGCNISILNFKCSCSNLFSYCHIVCFHRYMMYTHNYNSL